MKRIIRVLLFSLAGILSLLLIALLLRTFLLQSIEYEPAGGELLQLSMPEFARDCSTLSAAIRYKTVSRADESLVDRNEFYSFHSFLRSAFPNIHSHMTREVVGGMSLLYRWKGENPELKPVVIMAHMDVVPVEPGNWTHPPFSGTIADGYIWGRGTLDDKGSLIAILCAAEHLIQTGFHPQRTIYLSFGHDEETNGKGSQAIVTRFKNRGVVPEFVLDEGMSIVKGMVPGVEAPVALIGIAERGYLSIELVAHGEGGHSSLPPLRTVVGDICRAVANLEENQTRAKLSGATSKFFRHIGPHMPFLLRIPISNMWLFEPLIVSFLEGDPGSNAMFRTTTATTMLAGSAQDNILASKASAVINFQINPGETIESVERHVKETIRNDSIRINFLPGYNNPTPEAGIETSGYSIITGSIKNVFSDAIVTPALAIASTDGRFFTPLTKDVYRFSPNLHTDQSDVARLHGTDERVSIEIFKKQILFYADIMKRL
jgi:carboxypeptidase PM20D1